MKKQMAVLDKEGLYEEIENFYEQISEGFELGKDIDVEDELSKIIIAGVGGAETAGNLLKQYLKDKGYMVEIVKDYSLPGYADKDTLVFALVYGEKAEETIALYREAVKKKCVVVGISDGGKLEELSKLNDTKYIQLQKGIPQKMAYGLLFFSMLRVLENSNLIDQQKEFVRRTIRILKHNNFEEITGELAGKIAGKIPLIYASTKFEALAKKWKEDFNKNSKTPSFYNVFPSLIYNELEGFNNFSDNFHLLIIRSGDDDAKVKKIMASSKEVIRKKGVPVTEIAITGDCYLAKLFSAALIGDWLSFNLAIKNGIDPSKSDSLEELKKRLEL